MRVSSLRKLAKEVGKAKGSIARWMKLPWFPKKGGDGCWDSEEVVAAIEANVKSRGRGKDKMASSVTARSAKGNNSSSEETQHKASPSFCSGSLEGARAILDDAGSDGLSVSKALLHITSRELSKASASGTVERKHIDSLADALNQNRQLEKSYIELSVKRGELIERAVSAAVGWQLSERFRGVLDVLRSSLRNETLILTGDEEATRKLDDRFVELSESLLIKSVDEIEALLTEEAKRQGGLE